MNSRIGPAGLGILTSKDNNRATVNESKHNTAFTQKSRHNFCLYKGINSKKTKRV
jgi:hypothetical protein